MTLSHILVPFNGIFSFIGNFVLPKSLSVSGYGYYHGLFYLVCENIQKKEEILRSKNQSYQSWTDLKYLRRYSSPSSNLLFQHQLLFECHTKICNLWVNKTVATWWFVSMSQSWSSRQHNGPPRWPPLHMTVPNELKYIRQLQMNSN